MEEDLFHTLFEIGTCLHLCEMLNYTKIQYKVATQPTVSDYQIQNSEDIPLNICSKPLFNHRIEGDKMKTLPMLCPLLKINVSRDDSEKFYHDH